MDNHTNISISDREIIANPAIEGNAYFRLGYYSSHGKAIKVLDMMQEAYLSRERIEQVYIEQYGVIDHGYIGLIVFQMPSDEEVK
jgi:hypothetical protein